MDTEVIHKIIEKHGEKAGRLLAILQDIQFVYGYLPEHTLRLISKITNDSLVDIYGIASFHDSFTFSPPDNETPENGGASERGNYVSDVRCSACNHSLLESDHLIDDRPAVRVTVSFGMEHGSLMFSSWCGAYNIESEYRLPEEGIVNIFCPHCHTELFPAGNCSNCGTPMVPMINNKGKMIQICSCVECKNHNSKVRILAVKSTGHAALG